MVLDLRRGRYLTINGTGAALWHRLLTEADRAALVITLTDAFDVDQQQAGQDVDDFLDTLRSLNALVESDRGGTVGGTVPPQHPA